MKRRDFINLLGRTALAWPFASRAQNHLHPIAPPTVVASDRWAFLGNAAQTLPAAPSAFFNRPCVMDNGDIITIWDAPADATKSGVWIFGHDTNQWTNPDLSVFGTFPADWPRDATGRPLFRWENNFSDWDDLTSSVFWSTPAPTNFAAQDDVRFVRGTNTFVSFPKGLAGGDRMGGCWNGTAYMFGFVSGRFNQIEARALPDGPVVTYNDANVPPYGSAPTDLSGSPHGTVRGGVDHRTGMAWCFNNSNELYMRSLVLGAADPVGWFHLPTVGTKPNLGASYCLHEGLDLIIAYTGSAEAQSEDGFVGNDPGTTYILDLATLVWRLGPGPRAAVPTEVPQTSGALLYDRFNREVKFVLADGLFVWRLDVAPPSVPHFLQGGGGVESLTIPSRTFIMRPDPYVGSSTPGQVYRSMMIAKQNRLCHDAVGKRNILFGGDYANTLVSQTAAGMVWSYDPLLDLSGDPSQGFRQISGECHGPGKLTPCFPDDSQACGMDYKTDAFTCNPGGWRGSANDGVVDGSVCNIASDGKCQSTVGSTYYHGLMRMDRSGTWTGLSKSLEVLGGKQGHFDPVQRCLVCIDSSGGTIARVFVDSLTRDDNLLTAAGIGSNAVAGRLFQPGYMDGIDWAIDVVGRWGYVVSVGDVYVGGNYNHSENFFWRFNLDIPGFMQPLADPPFGSHSTYNTLSPTGFPYGAGGTDRVHCQWDSRNRRVIWFYTRSIGAGVHGIGAYNPVTNTWENIPIVTDGSLGPTTYKHVAGNCQGYDSTNNVHILMGAAALGSPGDDPYGEEDSQGWSPTHYSLWRYA